jgi:flavin-binding protein dodecin
MANHVYSISEIVGSSPDSIEGAVQNALARASKTLRNLNWFVVTETRGQITDGQIDHFQVTIKVGFRMEG